MILDQLDYGVRFLIFSFDKSIVYDTIQSIIPGTATAVYFEVPVSFKSGTKTRKNSSQVPHP